MTNPCKDCPYKGCGPRHGTCEKYRAFREHNERIYAKRIQQGAINDYHFRAVKKSRRGLNDYVKGGNVI